MIFIWTTPVEEDASPRNNQNPLELECLSYIKAGFPVYVKAYKVM